MGTYKLFATVEMSVEGFHVTNGKSLGAASILYFSLLLMMSSSLKLISAIFLDRLCRMLTCVVNSEKKRIMDWLQFGYLRVLRQITIRSISYDLERTTVLRLSQGGKQTGELTRLTSPSRVERRLRRSDGWKSDMEWMGAPPTDRSAGEWMRSRLQPSKACLCSAGERTGGAHLRPSRRRGSQS